jgi:arylsulfatase A-like enzyme
VAQTVAEASPTVHSLSGCAIPCASVPAVSRQRTGQCSEPSLQPTPGHRPNIVFIRTDDETITDMTIRRPDTGQFVMQHVLDYIAARGVTFQNSIVSMSLCSPSRATFLSGQYAHNHGVYSNSGIHGGYGAFDHSNSLAVWLDRAGYYNIHIGKYLNGYGGGGGDLLPPTSSTIPPGWHEWYTTIQATYFNAPANDNGVSTIAPGYITDVLSRKAVDFVHSHRFGNMPFFLVLDHTAPHGSSPPVPNTGDLPIPAPRHAHVFDEFTPSWPPNFGERDMSDKPFWMQQYPSLSQSSIQIIISSERARLGTLLAVDEGVGDLIHALESEGLLNDTYIFFTSDNGYELGEHRIINGKDRIYEESIRVPLLVRGPGLRPGSTIQELVANIDYAPTIVDLAHATANRVMDGVSLVPLLSDNVTGWRRDILLENVTPLFSGIRNDRFLYAEESSTGTGLIDGVELYSLAADDCGTMPDPWELQSLHADVCHSDVINRFHVRLLALRHCVGQNCQGL